MRNPVNCSNFESLYDLTDFLHTIRTLFELQYRINTRNTQAPMPAWYAHSFNFAYQTHDTFLLWVSSLPLLFLLDETSTVVNSIVLVFLIIGILFRIGFRFLFFVLFRWFLILFNWCWVWDWYLFRCWARIFKKFMLIWGYLVFMRILLLIFLLIFLFLKSFFVGLWSLSFLWLVWGCV